MEYLSNILFHIINLRQNRFTEHSTNYNQVDSHIKYFSSIITFDLAAKDTIVRCRSFLSCGGVRAGSELALAAKISSHREIKLSIINNFSFF